MDYHFDYTLYPGNFPCVFRVTWTYEARILVAIWNVICIQLRRWKRNMWQTHTTRKDVTERYFRRLLKKNIRYTWNRTINVTNFHFFSTGHYLKMLHINSLAPGKCGDNFKGVISELIWIKFMSTCEITLSWMPQNTLDDKVNIGSGNGLVPFGTKPLPETMLIQIYVTTWHH